MEIDVFISHHTDSSLHITESIVNQLEFHGVRCWYAPRNTENAYAGSITKAIRACSVFLLILNQPASENVHVLNEIDIVTKRLARKERVCLIPFHIADEEISDDAQYYIGRLHWIDAITPPMYQRINELTDIILQILEKRRTGSDGSDDLPAAPSSYQLISKPPQARSIFAGREELLEKIHSLFQKGERVLFLKGIGGIGKSELSKQYALAHQDLYRQILFVTFVDSLQNLVCDPCQIEIAQLEPYEKESKEAFFRRKMQVFRTLADEKTLLIVDNFDTDTDPDLAGFLEGRHRVIFTSRNSHPGYPEVKVNAIPDTRVLFDVFERNYGMAVEEEDRIWLEKLFEMVEHHTYTIELLARQMEASFLGPREMFELMEKGSADVLTETVPGRNAQKTAFAHLCSLFSISGLNKEERQILRLLSLMGTRGVSARKFREWSGLSSFDSVNRLIRRSWIRREAGQRLSLHPLITEVVRKNLTPTPENCHDFLEQIGTFVHYSWFRPARENLAAADTVLAVAEYFQPYDLSRIHIWMLLPSFLWQTGMFEASIYFAKIVYHTCLRELGEASMITGYAAKALAGCYFNSRRLPESIPWYRQGLRCMELSGETLSEDLAMACEKVARCYTWKYEQDFELADRYFQKALKIRLKMKELAEKGETLEMFESRWRSCDLALITARIGETYMEMGRMYQAMGDYEQALEYVRRYKGILLAQGTENLSGIAYAYYDEGVCFYRIGQKFRLLANETEAERNFQMALENLQKALDLNIQMRGEKALDTIENEEYLADTFAALKRYGEASNYYMAVINALEKLLGKDCPKLRTVKEKMKFR